MRPVWRNVLILALHPLVYLQGGIRLPVLECARCNELYYSAHGSTDMSCDACGAGVWHVFEDEVSFSRVVALPRSFAPGDHAAIVYTDVADAAGFCLAYLREGLERGEHAVMAVPAQLRDAVEKRLEPGEAARVDVSKPAQCYADFTPESVAERFVRIVKGSERPVRLLSGPDADSLDGMSADDWQRYERICHERVIELGVTALCVYDARSLPMAFPPVAVEAHPLLSRDGDELKRNSDFSYEPAGA
jgi:hypothetical protein